MLWGKAHAAPPRELKSLMREPTLDEAQKASLDQTKKQQPTSTGAQEQTVKT